MQNSGTVINVFRYTCITKYIPSSFCASRLFPILSRLSARLPTVAELPSLFIHSYSISLASSRHNLRSASIFTRIAGGSLSIMPKSCQHVPISLHISNTCVPFTTIYYCSSGVFCEINYTLNPKLSD